MNIKEKLDNMKKRNKGPTSTELHIIAWEKFGKDECEICGMSNEDHIKRYNKRLAMHCKLVPKDYTSDNPDDWVCCCTPCHGPLDEESRKYWATRCKLPKPKTGPGKPPEIPEKVDTVRDLAIHIFYNTGRVYGPDRR